MNQALRWMLILGCLMLAVLEAPRSSALVAEDFAGPYCEPVAARQAPSARTDEVRSNELTLADTALK